MKAADTKSVTRKGGKVVDTIPTYLWRRLVGGAPFHGGEIRARDLEKKTVVFGEGEEARTYVRKSRVMHGFRLVAFVDQEMPKSKFWPYIAMREIAKMHPDLMQITKAEAEG